MIIFQENIYVQRENNCYKKIKLMKSRGFCDSKREFSFSFDILQPLHSMLRNQIYGKSSI